MAESLDRSLPIDFDGDFQGRTTGGAQSGKIDLPERHLLLRRWGGGLGTSTTGRGHVWSPHRFLNSDGLVKRKELVAAVSRNG
jgi:hypothetical protein